MENKYKSIFPEEKYLLQTDVEHENITEAEIIRSQLGNISSKKYRQEYRKRLYNLIGVDVPNFGNNTGFKNGSLLFELKVMASQFFLMILEKLGLYVRFAKFFNRYPEDFK